MRIMAIDYGDARTGSPYRTPPVFWPALPLSSTAEERGGRGGDRRTDRRPRGWRAGHGLPRNMDGTEGPGPSSTGHSPDSWRSVPASPRCSGTKAAHHRGGPQHPPRQRQKMKQHKETVDAVATRADPGGAISPSAGTALIPSPPACIPHIMFWKGVFSHAYRAQ